MARKQSLADQAKRLDDVCCPVHGIPLYQEASELPVKLSIAGCTRGDCDIMAVVDFFDHDDGTFESRVRQLITSEQLDRLQALWWGIYSKALGEADEKINAELKKMALSHDIQ